MSRTFKDQPLWLRAKKEHAHNHLINDYHEHTRFGKPVIRYAIKFQNGEPVYRLEEENEEVPFYFFHPHRVFLINAIRHVLVYEETVVGHYADYCTIDSPVDDKKHFSRHKPYTTESEHDVFSPCERHFKWGYVYYGKPTKHERINYQAVRRARETTSLKHVTNMFNSGEDIEEVSANPYINRKSFHEGWWD